MPAAVEPRSGWVVLGPHPVLRCHPALWPAGRWWRELTEATAELSWQVAIDPSPMRSDAAGMRIELADELSPEAYTLEIGPGGVDVRAADPRGAHHALQTLRQVIGPAAFRRSHLPDAGALRLPRLRIEDRPRYAWRGVLLDVARHFMPKDAVLRFVELLAAHKLNVLHLHLTDDQGWRMQVRRHPRLTEVGSWRRESSVGTWRAGLHDGRPHGGFYTQDDLHEIVSYAAARGVTVVPEIDVPGHVQAAIAAYPELGVDPGDAEVRSSWSISANVLDPSESTLQFFRDVLDEVAEVFDAPWICLGGDEVPTTRWRESPAITARAAALGLADVADLHGWFVGQLAAHVSKLGRRASVWDEAAGPQLPADAVVCSWRGFTGAADALRSGHDVVMCPEQFVYLDHRQDDGPDEPVPVGFLRTLDDVYSFDPEPSVVREALGDNSGQVLGTQAQVWTEHLDDPRRVDYAAFPRLAAFAEVAWSDPGRRDLADFRRRLREHLGRLDAFGVEYRPPAGPHPWQTRPGVPGWPRDFDAEWRRGGWAGVGGWHDDSTSADVGEGTDDPADPARTTDPAGPPRTDRGDT